MQPSITTVPLLQLASGDRLSLQIYKFIGSKPGKKVYIQANLHGAELAGNAVIHQLLDWLSVVEPDQMQGEIWLVPLCNPLGVNHRTHHFATGRFNPYDGKDWNRIFWDYEKDAKDLMEFAESQKELDPATIQQNFRQRMLESFRQLGEKIKSPAGVSVSDRYRYHLQSLALDADYIIDLHSSSNQGINYVYYFRGRDDHARLFLLEMAALLNEYDGDAFDEAFMKPWLALEDCMAKLGRPMQFDVAAWTLELGSGMQLNPESVSKGLRGVKHYLMQRGIVVFGEPLPPPETHTLFTVHTAMKRYFSPAGGVLQSRVPLGATVETGQRLYQVLSFNKEGKLPTVIDVQAEQGGWVFDVSTSEVVNEGEYVIGIVPMA